MTSVPPPEPPLPAPSADPPYLQLPLVEVREPAHRVSPRAVHYWRLCSLFLTLPLWAAAILGWFLLDRHPWWLVVPTLALLTASTLWSSLMPPLAYRVRRWEVTPTAIHTRTGWLGEHHTLIPLSRVQTIDYSQGVIQRAFGLAEVLASTASSLGNVSISGIPAADAQVLRAQLARITEESSQPGDDAT